MKSNNKRGEQPNEYQHSWFRSAIHLVYKWRNGNIVLIIKMEIKMIWKCFFNVLKLF